MPTFLSVSLQAIIISKKGESGVMCTPTKMCTQSVSCSFPVVYAEISIELMRLYMSKSSLCSLVRPVNTSKRDNTQLAFVCLPIHHWNRSRSPRFDLDAVIHNFHFDSHFEFQSALVSSQSNILPHCSSPHCHFAWKRTFHFYRGPCCGESFQKMK